MAASAKFLKEATDFDSENKPFVSQQKTIFLVLNYIFKYELISVLLCMYE